MAFAGINYLAVFVAALAAWIVGAAYYGTLAKHWLAAQDKTLEEVKAGGTPIVPYAIAFLAELVMAWVLAGLIGHMGAVTVRSGVISALFAWLGFVVTTVGVNNMFGTRKPMLTVIDAGHWLAALVVMGAIIGAFGV